MRKSPLLFVILAFLLIPYQTPAEILKDVYGAGSDLGAGFKAFKPHANMISNPQFHVPQGTELPSGWQTSISEEINTQKAIFLLKSSDMFELSLKGAASIPVSNCIGIRAKKGRSGYWSSRLPVCETGREYVFTGRLYRRNWENRKYPEIRLWGKNFLINTHWIPKVFQPIRLYVTCPENVDAPTFRFINKNRGTAFWLTRPRLVKNDVFDRELGFQEKPRQFFKNLFPIGVYGAKMENLPQIKRLAVNTVLLSARGQRLKKTVQQCHALGLKYILSVPRDPARLPVFLNAIAKYVRPTELAFYVNDEPGIHSFPTNRANDIQRLIKDKFPQSATCMAVVRPQVCRDYLQASDFFMMDPYPVPFMPMTWLSDSMDAAQKHVGRNRLASVIQAFGGKRWAQVGWPRLPTWREMDCLAFLSVVHGARGIFFYTFSVIGKTAQGRQRLGRVIGRLNRIYPWLMVPNADQGLLAKMISPHRVDPKGRPAVHYSRKQKGDRRFLIAVNTIGTYVEAVLTVDGSGVAEFQEVFSGEYYPVENGEIRSDFGPYEAKAFLYSP